MREIMNVEERKKESIEEEEEDELPRSSICKFHSLFSGFRFSFTYIYTEERES